MTEHVHQRELYVLCRAAVWRHAQRRATTRGGQEQRRPFERSTTKAPRGWRRGRHEGRIGGLGASGASKADYATRVSNEGFRGFDVLHGAPPKRERHRKRGVQGLERDNHDMVATKPAVERESRHVWFFNAMLKAVKRNLTAKFGELTPSDRMKVEVSQGAPGDYRRWEVHRLQRVDQIVQASPNIRQALTSTQNTYHLATDGYITNKWRKPNADPGHVQQAARCMSVTP